MARFVILFYGVIAYLIFLFTFLMARPAFKIWWTSIIPKAAERSTYTLLSSRALILMFYYWHRLEKTMPIIARWSQR